MFNEVYKIISIKFINCKILYFSIISLSFSSFYTFKLQISSISNFESIFIVSIWKHYNSDIF
nr:MAG TPA: hypothetical protein [Bacteriophage sp.]DAI57945.1 MAG TPA: hypothetical protein [Caudoviricetes sp.]DAQ87965.1 MAG TPA: hypothetical protein [Caudoviricetes sp.]